MFCNSAPHSGSFRAGPGEKGTGPHGGADKPKAVPSALRATPPGSRQLFPGPHNATYRSLCTGLYPKEGLLKLDHPGRRAPSEKLCASNPETHAHMRHLQELREQQRQPSCLKDRRFYGRDVQSRRRDPADCQRLYHSRGEWQPVLNRRGTMSVSEVMTLDETTIHNSFKQPEGCRFVCASPISEETPFPQSVLIFDIRS